MELYVWLSHIVFLPYLWGIETTKKAQSQKARSVHFYPTYEALKLPCCFVKLHKVVKFLPYLWGIETIFLYCVKNLFVMFLPYLWGIETIFCLTNLEFCLYVFTLPMRHWNNGLRELTGAKNLSFYPTYEALKRVKSERDRKNRVKFLPYLWGIETAQERLEEGASLKRFYPTYEALKLFHHSECSSSQGVVFTLPMRHWNKSIKLFLMWSVIVFTLPMRHWNFNLMASSIYPRNCFYPTYEALKRTFKENLKSPQRSFYPTYEALKPKIGNTRKRALKSFYPTYEALKPFFTTTLLNP